MGKGDIPAEDKMEGAWYALMLIQSLTTLEISSGSTFDPKSGSFQLTFPCEDEELTLDENHSS